MKKLFLALTAILVASAPAAAIPNNWKIGGGFNDQEIRRLINELQWLNLYTPVQCGGNVIHINAYDPFGNPADRPICFSPNPAVSPITAGMYNYRMGGGGLTPHNINGQFQQPQTIQQRQQQQQSPHNGNW